MRASTTSENKAALTRALSALSTGAKDLYRATAHLQVMKHS